MFELRKIIGRSVVAEQIKAFIERAARYDFTVLLSGETGVGKEVVARNIHFLSRRQKGPFIPINCSCINNGLAESELFGHKRGSFTDCKEDKPSLFEAAEGGTIFFDEIADLPYILQPKLLRVIEEKEVRRVGDVNSRRVDMRFIFATNRNLVSEVKSGTFRKDLFYRINSLYLNIPPLRERKEDLALFIDELLRELNAENQADKKISADAILLLTTYRYPGNVRELGNILQRAFSECACMEIRAKDISLGEEATEEDATEKLYQGMVNKGGNFWEIIHEPFIKRELSRNEVQEVIALGLRHVGGSYKKLMGLYNAGKSEKDYKKFMSVLRCHRLKSRLKRS